MRPASSATPIIDQTRPTTNKNAIVAGGYRLLKVDTLDNRSISDNILDEHDERGARRAGRRRRLQRFPPRHLQPRHDPAAHRGDARGRLQRRRQPGRQPLGQHPRVPGLRPDHAERARGALRARRPGFGRAAAGLAALRRGAVQVADPQARRARHDDLPRRADHEIARRFFVHRQLRRSRGRRRRRRRRAARLCDAGACWSAATTRSPRSSAPSRPPCECEHDGNVPVTPDGVHREARRRSRST